MNTQLLQLQQKKVKVEVSGGVRKTEDSCSWTWTFRRTRAPWRSHRGEPRVSTPERKSSALRPPPAVAAPMPDTDRHTTRLPHAAQCPVSLSLLNHVGMGLHGRRTGRETRGGADLVGWVCG